MCLRINRILYTLLLVFVLNLYLHAQLSGTFSIPGSYSTLATAINDLNSQGLNGPVVMEVLAGHTETVPVGGLTLTASGTSVNTLVFRKSGIGSNPLLIAYAGGTRTPGTAVQDGIWSFVGCDYVTVDGIDLLDPNSTNPSTMEYGFGFFKASAADGCQNNRIQNCVISLNRVNNATGAGPSVDGSRGINLVSALIGSQTTVLTVTAASGSNSDNRFYGNTIGNCNIGIALIGFAAPFPFSLADRNNDVGGNSLSSGNSILNFGGGGITNPAAAIRTLAQYDLNVSFNRIHNNDGSGINHATTLRGIYLNTAQSANVVVNSNTLTLQGGSSNSQVSVIENLSGASALSNSVLIQNNLITACSNSLNSSGNFFSIYNNGANAQYLSISANTITGNNHFSANASTFFIYNNAAVTGSIVLSNNLISGNTVSATTTGISYMIYNNAAGTARLQMETNRIENNQGFTNSGSGFLLYNAQSTSGGISISSNTIQSNFFQSQSGSCYQVYNTGPGTGATILDQNSIQQNTLNLGSTAVHYAISNNAASTSTLQMQLNRYENNAVITGSGLNALFFLSGVPANLYNSVQINSNLVANNSFTSTLNAQYYLLYNNFCTAGDLSISNNTVSNCAWTGTASTKILIGNTGSVSAGPCTFTGNLISQLSNSNNLSGGFYGIYNTSAINGDLLANSNSFSDIQSAASTGFAALIFNSGSVAGRRYMQFNQMRSLQFNATGNADFNGIFNTGSTSAEIELSSNTFSNVSLSRAGGVACLVQNAGPAASSIGTLNISNNSVENYTCAFSQNGSAFMFYNNGVSARELRMVSNSVLNASSTQSNGACHLFYNRGILTNTFDLVNISSNLMQQFNFSANGNGAFYPVFNNGVSAFSLSISGNSLVTISNTASLSLVQHIGNSGQSGGNILVQNNLLSAYTAASNSSGVLYFINNTATSGAGLSILSNTILNPAVAASAGDIYLMHNSGSSPSSVLEIRNNLVQGYSGTQTGAGAFYGFYQNAVNASSLSINANTVIAANRQGAGGASYWYYVRGTAATSVALQELKDNVISGLSTSMTAAGANYVFNATSGNVTNLDIRSNHLSNLNWFSTNANRFLITNAAIVSGLTRIQQNTLSAISSSLNTTGVFYGIQNAVPASVSQLTLSGNSLSDLRLNSSNGDVYFISSTGTQSAGIQMVGNKLSDFTVTASLSANIFGISNGSGASQALGIHSNSIQSALVTHSTGSFYGFYNTAANSQSISFEQNVLSALSATSASGSAFFLYNNAASAPVLSIGQNTLSGIQYSLANGPLHLLYNRGTGANLFNLVAISENVLNQCTVSVSGIANQNYMIFNNGVNCASLSISSNTLSDVLWNTQSSGRFLIYNTATSSLGINISNNRIQNHSSPVNSTGLFYALFNNSGASANLTIQGNLLDQLQAQSGSALHYLIHNLANISNALSIGSNSLSNCSVSSSGNASFFGINNRSFSASTVNISQNSITNQSLGTVNGSLALLYNYGAAGNTVSLLDIRNNVVSGASLSTSGNALLFGVVNDLATSSTLNIAGNRIDNMFSPSAAGNRFLILNSGITSSLVSITQNTLSQVNFSNNLSGNLYALANTGPGQGTLQINGNDLDQLQLSSGTASVFVLANTANVAQYREIRNNRLNAIQSLSSFNGRYFAVLNQSHNSAYLGITGNTLSAHTIQTGTVPLFMIYNTAAPSISVTSIEMNQNLISGGSQKILGNAPYYALFNNSVSTQSLSMDGNRFLNHSLDVQQGDRYMVYNTSGSVSVISMSANQFSACTYADTMSAVFYGIMNSGRFISQLSMNANLFSSNALSTRSSSVYLVLNNAGGLTQPNVLSISGNTIQNNQFNISQNRPLHFLYQRGDTISTVQVNSNSILTNTVQIPAGMFHPMLNQGNQLQALSMSSNFINTNRLQLSPNDLYLIRNLALSSNTVALNSNTVTSNLDDRSSGDTYLLANSGLTHSLVSYNQNHLSHIFNGSGFPYVGEFNGIFCPFSGSLSTVQINANLFSSINFSTATGLGPIHFINQNSSAQALQVNQNQWLNVQLKHAGPHYFIRNTGSVQNQLQVEQNQLNGYERQFAAASDFYFYYANAITVPTTCVQSFTGNSISNVSVTVPGVGLLAGIYSADGGISPYPQKTFRANLLQNINSSGAGDLIGIYANYLGQANLNQPSTIASNTISNLNGEGNLFGIYTGTPGSPALGPLVHSNLLHDFISNGTNASLYPACLNTNNAGLRFYKNKVYGIAANGISAQAYGVYVGQATNLELSNNRIGLISAPSSTLQFPVNGIYSAGGQSLNIFYNTVYLNATSTASDFNSNALYSSSEQFLSLKNNILVNTSVANGTGLSVAFRRAQSGLSTYDPASDRNTFYSGAGFTGNAIFCAPGQSLTNLFALQSLLNPREANSHKEPVPFLSTSGNQNTFLALDPVLPSLCESGATNLSGISDDFDAQVRQGNIGYAGTGTAPDIGSDEYNRSLPPCNAVSAGSISPISSTLCAGQRISLQSSGYTYSNAGGISYQWLSSSSSSGPFAPVSGGSAPNKTEYTSAPLNTGIVYFVLSATCASNAQTSVSNQATVVVWPSPSASLSISNATLCSGGGTQLNLGTDIGSSFLWTGPSNYSSAVQSPVLSNVPTTGAGTYTALVTATNGCTNGGTVALQVFPSVPAFSITPAQPAICLGDSILISSSIPANSATLLAGAQNAQNAANSYPAPYSNYYGGQRMQFLIQSSELQASGFHAGSPIYAISFPVVSLGAAWGNTVVDCKDFRISIGHTSLNNLTSFQTALQEVKPSYNFTPGTGFNTHVFANPFIWDGNSNLVVETVFSNNNTGNASSAVIHNIHTTGFQSTVLYRADNQSFATIAAATTSNVNLGALRPDFRLLAATTGSYSWTPFTGLASGNSFSTQASPASSQLYTLSLNNGSCSAVNTVSLQVSQTPSLSVSGTSSLVCVGNSATLSALGASSYTWSNGAVNAFIVITPLGNSTFVVTGANPACPTASAAISVSVAPALLVSASSSSPVICAGQSSTLTAAGANSYTWSNGANSATTVVSPSLSSTYTVTGSNGPGCFAQQIVSVQSNSLPVLSCQPATATLCAGESLELTGSGAISYTWLPSSLTSANLLIIPQSSGSYTLLGQGSNQCVAAIPVMVTVDDCLALNEMSSLQGILVYPNPSNGLFMIRHKNCPGFRVQVFDAGGRRIMEQSEAGTESQIDLGEHAKGLYLLRLESECGNGLFRLLLQ